MGQSCVSIELDVSSPGGVPIDGSGMLVELPRTCDGERTYAGRYIRRMIGDLILVLEGLIRQGQSHQGPAPGAPDDAHAPAHDATQMAR